MAEQKPARKRTQASGKTATGKAPEGFTDDERAAMRERAQELKAVARRGRRAAKADKDGNVVCFFQDAKKFKTRYATLGFSDKAALDEGNMWPTAFALKELTAADEARIAGLVEQAVS